MYKMKFCHWELLLDIYQYQVSYSGIKILENQVNKNLLKTLYKQKWIEKLPDDTIIVTEKGIEDCKQIAKLYERNNVQIGQTF